jgi:hypothetical protein
MRLLRWKYSQIGYSQIHINSFIFWIKRWLQIRLDLISDLAVFICVLVAILLANKGIITLGALAMVIGCGYTVSGGGGPVQLMSAVACVAH